VAVKFKVTSPEGPVQLDLRGRGRCQVQVENLIPEALRVKLQFDAKNPVKAWMSVEGEPVMMAVKDAHQFQVAINVPVGAAPGDYSIVPEAASLRNPDDENGTGVPIRFTVKPPPGAPPKSSGYLTTLIGAMAAALVAALVGTLPGILWLITVAHVPPGVNEDLGQALGRIIAEAIFAAILIGLGLLVGLWIGPPIGALIALRLRSYPGAGWTAAALAVLQPVWLVVLIVLINVVKINLKLNGLGNTLVAIALYILATALPPFPARALALLLRRWRG
jgi:hypothetical protein